jgi:hypothetical protein
MMRILKKYGTAVCATLAIFVYQTVTVSISANSRKYDETAGNMATDTIVYQPSLKYGFPKAAPNEIVDSAGVLHDFFGRLSSLRSSAGDSVSTVSIVHMGDSHIQADFFTGTVRKLMNHYFGNPGRGLIAPHKLMKSNNGRHYKINSTNRWQHSFVVKPNDIPIGITGMGLQVKDFAADADILTVDESFQGEWDFNRITAYCNLEKADVYLLHPDVTETDTIGSFAKSFLLDSLTNSAEINFISPEKEISFSGFHLSNGKRGVFYNSIGINGAKFCSYSLCTDDFYGQVASLNPDLVILSMGTNEAIGAIDEYRLYSDISELVFHIRHSSPNTIVLFTTPAETYARAGRRTPTVANGKIGKVRDIIVDFAEKNGYPYWDLYNITGGKGSAPEWNKKKLMVRDRIHLTQRGYEYQGELLFEAIVKSYNQYIKANT